MDIPQQETEMDINLLYLNVNYLVVFNYLQSGVVHTNQKPVSTTERSTLVSPGAHYS